MRVKVRLSALLRQASEWQEWVEVEAETPGTCLEKLEDRYPDMRRWIYTPEGRVWDRLQLFVNGRLIRGEEIRIPMQEDDELFVLLNIGGG